MILLHKKGMSGVLLSIIILAILLLILSPLLGRMGRSAADTFKCESPSKNGECLPEATTDRIPLGGLYTDCEKKSKDTGQSLSCFFKKEVQGGGIPHVDEIPVDQGLNLRRVTFAGEHASMVPSVQTSPRAETIIENLKISDKPSITLYVGRMYAFYGVISGIAFEYCSIYIRKGEFAPGTSNIYGSVSKSKCNDPKTWSAPLYFVPKDGDNTLNLQLVMVKKSSLDDTGFNDPLVVNLEIKSKPVVKYDNFKGHAGTSMDAIVNGEYLDGKPKSFALENAKVRLEFQNTVIGADPYLNFDDIITWGVDEIRIDGTKLNYLSSGLVKITIKDTPWKTPPNPLLAYYSYTGQADPTFKEAYKSCDICKSPSFSQSGSVTFQADVKGKFLIFKVFPGTCGILSKTECLDMPLKVAGLECYWKNTQCLKCERTLVKECGDYGRERAFCIADSCNIDNDPNFDSACTYVERNWWPDACVSCKDKKACKDYDAIKEACEEDPCSINKACTWSPAKDKCVDCKAVSSCSDYDRIARDEAFCRQNVCGVGEGCLRAGGSCIAKQGGMAA